MFYAGTNGIEAWVYIKKEEMREKWIERIQGKALKRIFKLPLSTAYTGILTEAGTCSTEQRIQYAILMLYHNIRIVMKKEKSRRW